MNSLAPEIEVVPSSPAANIAILLARFESAEQSPCVRDWLFGQKKTRSAQAISQVAATEYLG
jgi:hypothetical protein